MEINDKHIEVIVRQMLQKVKILDPGDTNFLEGEEVDKIRFNRENEKVIGEGGNLGITQLGRVEYCLQGGAANTDFIDNAGGVNCSDHEVNIKILLNEIVSAGDMTGKQRDQLLFEMTDAVAELVLHDNYKQTQALSQAERRAHRITTSARHPRLRKAAVDPRIAL